MLRRCLGVFFASCSSKVTFSRKLHAEKWISENSTQIHLNSLCECKHGYHFAIVKMFYSVIAVKLYGVFLAECFATVMFASDFDSSDDKTEQSFTLISNSICHLGCGCGERFWMEEMENFHNWMQHFYYFYSSQRFCAFSIRDIYCLLINVGFLPLLLNT